MKKQKITFIRGIPGSGKTTIAQKLNAELVEADMFFIHKDGEYKHDKRFIKDAHSWCQQEMKRLLLAGHNIVVANTFIKKWEVENYLKLAQSLGLDLEVEVIEAKGRYQNVHGVPDESVERMRNQYQPFVLVQMWNSENNQLDMA
ncbi:AAA family ATPase [Vibrio cyclitrophicus]|uniref:AAA family ATPase n=1 Tax=Vibrio cyclitrophicus TaxID=47951 RepID=UPI000C819F0E|nr:AAA family ATPase [Vibrio cyclitrophicus]PMJ99079.1 AAA family ATPase [Vibrio cyclitrophicus]